MLSVSFVEHNPFQHSIFALAPRKLTDIVAETRTFSRARHGIRCFYIQWIYYATNSIFLLAASSSCPPPAVPLYSTVKVENGAASYSCDTGYELFGSGTRKCHNNKWEGALPYCGEYFRPHPNYSPSKLATCFRRSQQRQQRLRPCRAGLTVERGFASPLLRLKSRPASD